MVLFVTCFAIAAARFVTAVLRICRSGVWAICGILAGMLISHGTRAVAGVRDVLANSVALVVPFLGGPVMRLSCVRGLWFARIDHIRGVRQGAGAVQ